MAKWTADSLRDSCPRLSWGTAPASPPRDAWMDCCDHLLQPGTSLCVWTSDTFRGNTGPLLDPSTAVRATLPEYLRIMGQSNVFHFVYTVPVTGNPYQPEPAAADDVTRDGTGHVVELQVRIIVLKN